MMGTKAERAQEALDAAMSMYLDLEAELKRLARLGYPLDEADVTKWCDLWIGLNEMRYEIEEDLLCEEEERREAEEDDEEEEG